MGHWCDVQVHPHCGDGVEISVLYTDSVKGTTDVLHAAEYAVQQAPVRCALVLGAVVLHSSKWASSDISAIRSTRFCAVSCLNTPCVEGLFSGDA